VVPVDKLEARVEVPSDKRGFVSVGQMSDVSIDSFPATDFGVLQGRVRRIGSDALPPDQIKTFSRYPADIQLEARSVMVCPEDVNGDVCFRTPRGQSLPLEVGMSLTANIKLRKVTYLQLLLSDFKDKADSLRRL
jgi:hemolysin D